MLDVRYDRILTSNGYTGEEIDAVVAYLPQVDALCWFGPEVFAGRSALTVRLAPSANGQQKGVPSWYYGDFRW